LLDGWAVFLFLVEDRAKIVVGVRQRLVVLDRLLEIFASFLVALDL